MKGQSLDSISQIVLWYEHTWTCLWLFDEIIQCTIIYAWEFKLWHSQVCKSM